MKKEDDPKDSKESSQTEEYEKEDKGGGFWAVMGAVAIMLLLVVLCGGIVLGLVAICYGLGYLLSLILPLTVYQAALMTLLVVFGGTMIIVLLLILSLQFSSRDALEKISLDMEGLTEKLFSLIESSLKRGKTDSSGVEVPLRLSSKQKPPN